MSAGVGRRADRTALRHAVASPSMALGLGVLTALLVVASFVLSPLAHQGTTQYIWLLPYGIVGMVIAYRRPGNPIGWIMIATGLVTLLCSDAGIYAVLIYVDGHRGLPLGRVAVALSAFWIAFVLLLPLPILLFPDGRVPADRWRFAAWAYAAVGVLALVVSGIVDIGAFADHHLRIDASGELTAFDGGGAGSVVAPITLLYLALTLSFIARQAIAYRAASGERRAQLKWLVSGSAVTIVGFVAALALKSSGSAVLGTIANIGFLGALVLPVCMAVGIFKYRLYEIDQLVSRTLSYAIVTALIVGTFVGLVALTTRALPLSSSVGVAASTLAAAALFDPLRRRVQRLVDRRFNRARYDAEQTVAAFAARLRDAVDLDMVQSELLDVVQRAVEPGHASVWIGPVGRRPEEAARR